jgi:hypothetical protein
MTKQQHFSMYYKDNNRNRHKGLLVTYIASNVHPTSIVSSYNYMVIVHQLWCHPTTIVKKMSSFHHITLHHLSG